MTQDFERNWLRKFSDNLACIADDQIRDQVMAGSDGLSDDSSHAEVIAWSQGALERLDTLLPEQDRQAILLACACHLPSESLQDIRRDFQEFGDLDRVMAQLQGEFEQMLRALPGITDEMFQQVVSWGMGMAGVRQGETIIATKIPKREHLVDYFNESDPRKRREYYCHCPRIREVLKSGEKLSKTYCYCGGGFYQRLWEDITGGPVKVKLLRSVLAGDDVCSFAIKLPKQSPGEV
jgi:hypothetical protein